MKTGLFCVFFFWLIANFGFGQTKEVDSLESLIIQTERPEEKINIFIKLYLETKNNSDSAVEYLNKAEKFINESVHDSITTLWNINKADYFMSKGDYDKTLSSLKTALSKTSIQNPETLIDIYAITGKAYYHKGDYEKAIKTYFSGLNISDSLKIIDKTARLYNNIGISYIKLENWSKAEQYMTESLKICKELNLKAGASFTLGNLGIIYRNQKKYSAALNMYEASIKISETLNDRRAIARTKSSIGTLYEDKSDLKKSIKYYSEALEIMKKLSDKQSISINYQRLGNIYIKLNDFKNAKSNLEKGLMISNEAGILNNSMEIYKSLSLLYELQGDFKSSLNEIKSYESLKDSIISKDHLLAISGMDAQYQSEKKDKEITEQKLVLADQQLSIQESKSKTRTMSILIVSLLLASILLWFSFRQRQKRMQQQLVAIEREQEVRTLESLMEGEEKERLRIAKELHDGVNGDLAAIKFKLTSLLETNNQVINEAVEMIDTSSEQVRAISHNLVPPSLRDFNLLEAVGAYCENMNGIHEPEITFQHLGNDIVLDKKQEANLFRIVQELVTNSIKHAEAKEIQIQLSNVEDNLQLTVEDDGKGFDAENVASDGIGMQNVKSRVAYLGGLIDIKSDEKGTSFMITITDKPSKA